jgi:hypothetical protein
MMIELSTASRLLNRFGKWVVPIGVPLGLALASACSSDEGSAPAATSGASSGGNTGSGGSSGGKSGSGGSSGGTPSTGGTGSGGQPGPSGGTSGAGNGGAGMGGGSSGAGSTGGSKASGGAAGASGGGGVSGSGGSVQAGSGGKSTGGASAGAAGAAGGSGGGNDTRPWFSFFVTSMEGLLMLAPDKTNGFGGNLGGLEGADQICATLAKRGNPGDNKVWRAFLSTSGFNGGTKVDAIDRVGPGPWYDLTGRLLAQNVAGLDPGSNDGRPDGAQALVEMFATELGEPVRANTSIDNHDTLTGSTPQGRLYTQNSEIATCNDWTSATARGMVPVGHSWPRSDNNGRQWIQDHTVNGCEPGVFIDLGGGAPRDNYTVGGGGGYGAFYCFALGATPPPP